MEFRISQWIDLTNMEPWFGVEAKVKPREWLPCCEGDKPLLFVSRASALKRIAQLRRQYREETRT